jgi:16S rRNA U1498 N3-methylase RsmE
MPIVSLGPRILRTETAALVAISQILYQFETNPFLEK